MPNEILHKIKYLCRAIPKVEWSGILLYSVKGTIKDVDNMQIILKDIIPMHKGNATYTEYSFNEKKRDSSGYDDAMIDYFNENPNALEEDWKIGHIHSHNSMNVFFSGTDMEELEDNSPSHDFYLSLIVNNWMDFMAKVSFIASTENNVESVYKALDENGKLYDIEKVTLNVKKEKLFIYDCIVNSPEKEDLKVDEIFFNSVKNIIKKADVKIPVKHETFTSIPVKKHNVPKKEKEVLKKSASEFSKDLVENIPYKELSSLEMFAEEGLTDLEIFAITILRGSNGPDENVNTVELALEELVIFETQLTSEEISKSVLEKYSAIYEQCFDSEDDDHFIETTETVIELFEEFEENYEFLSNIIMALKYMVNKFEEYATTV